MFPPPDLGSREQKMKQIKNWAGSETDKSSADYHPPKKIKFPLGVALIAACYANDEEEFKRLLSLGIDINTRNPDGMTCVHQCCINGDYEFLEFLIKEGADINVQDNEGWTPLHAAASVGCEEMVRLLLDNGADLSLLSCEMELPVDVSQSDAVTELLNEAMQARGIDPTAARQTEEQLLLRDVKHMLESGKYEPIIDPRSGATPLHVAACKDYLSVLEMLLKIPDIDLNCQDNDGWTALHAAAHWNREASVRLLAEAGASFDLYTFANQSVFDVADRQITLLLRQLRERQRAEAKTVGPSPVPPATTETQPPPKPNEAVKRGHPSDSESAEDSEDSEASSAESENSISANKKPALDGEINSVGALSAAAGDQSTSVHPPTATLQKPSPDPTQPPRGDTLHSLSNDRRLQESKEHITTDDRPPTPHPPPSQSSMSPSTSPSTFQSLATTSTSTSERSSTFGATDSDSDQAPFALDPMDVIDKQPKQSTVSKNVIDILQLKTMESKAAENESISSIKNLSSDASSKPAIDTSVASSINGRTETSPAVRLTDSVPTGDKELEPTLSATSQSDRSEPRRPNDRAHESHVRLRSPPVRLNSASTRSPSPPIEQPTASPNLNETKPQSGRSTRIVTIRKRIPAVSTTDPVVSETAAAPGFPPPTFSVPATPVSSTNSTLRSSINPARPEVTRSPSPVSGDDYQGNRRVSAVMAPTKSGETETQRSVKARYVRSTRRSTQGVSAEELEKAKRLIDENNSAAVMPSSGTPAVGQHQSQSETKENTGESLRPRLDRPTVRITRAMAARTTSSSSPPTDSADSDIVTHGRRRLPPLSRDDAVSVTGSSADDSSQIRRDYRAAPEAQDRVSSPESRDRTSSSTTYFPYRGISARVPSTDEDTDRPSSRNQSATDVQNIRPRGSRERTMHDQLLEATENLERRIPLSQRRAMRQGAPSPTSPPPGYLSTANATSNDSTVKAVIPRPSSRFLHSNDSSSSIPTTTTNSGQSAIIPTTSTTTSTNTWNTSHPTSRSAVGAAHQQQATNTTTFSSRAATSVSDSRHPPESWSALRDRLNQYPAAVDYRRLYEQERAEKERLKRELEETRRNVARLRASLNRAESNHVVSGGTGNSTENSVSEELNRLREENLKMKEENGALIRVISKLSKPI